MRESMKTFLNRCRCCLQSFYEDEKYSPITEFFSIQFYAFTKLELKADELLSNHVCEFCHSELLRFSVFKKDLIEKQLKLYSLLKEHNSKILHTNEDNYYDSAENFEENTIDEVEYDEIDYLGSISENFTESPPPSQDHFDDDEEKSKIFICDYCNFKFKNKQGLSNHVKSHLTNTSGDIKCEKCEFSTTTRYRIAMHKKQFHNDHREESLETSDSNNKNEKEGVKPYGRIIKYRCFCGITFSKKASLDSHRTKKHGELKRCNYGCNSSYENIGLWIRHVRKNHPAYEIECLKMVNASKTNVWYTVIREHDYLEEFECQKCSFMAIDKPELENHLKTKHEGKDDKFECPECFKLFVSNSTLRIHVQTVHEEIRGYPCSICKASFKQVGHLKDHVRSVHKVAYTPYVCLDCPEAFPSVADLNKHQFTIHGKPLDKTQLKKKKKYYCSCKRFFIYPSRLWEHQVKCKLFALKGSKKEVITSATFKCGVCLRGFVHRGNLLRHQKQVGHVPK